MDKLFSEMLDSWRKEGEGLLKQNFEVFNSLVNQSKAFFEKGYYDNAAIYAKLASVYALLNHCGIFWNADLEEIIFKIGQRVMPTTEQEPHTRKDNNQKNILHIATSCNGVSGDTKMIYRWIQLDRERNHSLVLTEQKTLDDVPQILKEIIKDKKGEIHLLSANLGEYDIALKAKKLREIVESVDIIILHTYNCDIIPGIAFSNEKGLPPIIYVDHCDHLFRAGDRCSNILINTRISGLNIARERRNIKAANNILFPIILEQTKREVSRAEAKRKLGIPEDSILLLSIARAVKYITVGEITFADVHISLLQSHKNTYLIVVGAGLREDWLKAIHETEGRIITYQECEDTSLFYQAADIYVDSFPFVSTTSLLEAGQFEIPLVTRFPFPSSCEIFGADTPGLAGNLIKTYCLDEYIDKLTLLIKDKEYRQVLGKKTHNKIIETHTNQKLQKSLEEIYSSVNVEKKIRTETESSVRINIDEPDVFIPHIYNVHNFTESNIDWIILGHLNKFPITYQYKTWLRVFRKSGMRQRLSLLSLFIPKSIKVSLQLRMRKLNYLIKRIGK